MPAKPVVLEMERVSRSFRAGVRGCSISVVALDEVSFRVRASERLGVLGPAAAGKTSLLLCAAGLIRPDHGSIRWHGDRRRIALASDRDGLYAFLTAREALDHHITMHGLPALDRERRIADSLERAGLAALSECRLSFLPPGARRRLAVAQALLTEPWLLLLDGTLDALPRADMQVVRACLLETAARGCAMIVASRDADTLAMVAERTITLRAPGAIVPAAQGPLPRLAAVSERRYSDER